jgi:hypothetical protein
VTAVVDAGRAVSVPELQRAWRAVQSGSFQQEWPVTAARADAISNSRIWAPGNAGQILPVVGCSGASGASTIALALASAGGGSARILECRGTTMTENEGLSLREVAEWCGSGVTVREIVRLLRSTAAIRAVETDVSDEGQAGLA